MIIAIDGHSSCGKSTIAKTLAKTLGYVYVDTGAMYRAVTLFCLENNILQNNTVQEDILAASLDSIHIEFNINQQTGQQETYLNGRCVEKEIRGLLVSEQVSLVSKIPLVRQKLVALQQEYGKHGNIVMDGRDIGTVVFPHADKKFFVTASAQIRAQRRYDELQAKGEEVTFDDILQNIESRDLQDSTRADSPLKQAPDALLLDNSTLTKEEQMKWILDHVS